MTGRAGRLVRCARYHLSLAHRRMYRRACYLVMLLLLASGPGRLARAQATDRPNVVILFADDLGYGDLSSYGHPLIRTPNLDTMAAEGMRLTSFYVASPACTPSRAALLTGRYPHRVGLPNVLGPGSERGLPASEITLAEALKAQGYRTAAIGKWHLGDAPAFSPTRHGFDQYFGLLYSNDMMPPWVQTDKPLALYRGEEAVEHPVDQSTLTERYTDEAVRFIETSAGQPFFLYLAYAMPHLPLAAPARFRGRSRAGLYGDVIETIDWSAGRILEALKAAGVDERTLVFFTSDNGPWLNLPARMLQDGVEPWHAGSPGLLRGWKHTSYEGGPRVPCIVRWPGRIPAGQVSAEVTTALDLFPTIVQLAGAPLPADRPLDGHDLMPLLTGRATTSPTEVFYYFRGDMLEGVREGRWKYRLSNNAAEAGSPDAPVPELYDLYVDPAERYNQATLHPDFVERLHARLVSFANEVEAGHF